MRRVNKKNSRVVFKLYSPKAIQLGEIVAGLLTCSRDLNAFPISFDIAGGEIGNRLVAKSNVQHVSGAYSSGSVQDFHLIPFSLHSSKMNLKCVTPTIRRQR